MMRRSYFDTGKDLSERTPENFYHGLVLGLIVSLREQYRIVSNRESGRGRYDIVMYPLQKDMDARKSLWDGPSGSRNFQGTDL